MVAVNSKKMTDQKISQIIGLLKSARVAPISSYLETEQRTFAIYTIQQRAIPCFNGLKPVQQRALWALQTVSKYEKVATLAGQVLPFHPHGDASISEALNQMTGPFCNNYQFFDDHGAFGTRINPTAFGSPRYTSAKISQFTRDVVFKDIEIVQLKKNYDHTRDEPIMFLPLVPLALLNGVIGIATGYATSILPRRLDEIIDQQINALNGKPVLNPVPFSKPIDCRAVVEPEPYKFSFYGDVDIIDGDTCRVKKLPYGMTHQRFLETLKEMVDSHKIINYVDKSKKELDIIVKFKKASLKNKKPDSVIRTLKLISRYTENVNILLPAEEEGTEQISNFNDVERYIQQYTEWRLKFYPQRFKRLIELNDIDIQKNTDIMLAIENNLGDHAKKAKNKSELMEFIVKLNIVNVEYIATLPVYRFTIEEYDKSKTRIENLTAENEEYQSIIDDVDKQKKLYIKELTESKKKYSK